MDFKSDLQIDLPISPIDFSVYFKSKPGFRLTFVLDGVAPTGLTLNPVTGIMAGAPTIAGVFDNIKILVTDSQQKRLISNAFSMRVFTVEENTVTITATNNVFFVQDSFVMRFKRY